MPMEVGFTEILLICALALVVLGPEKLPKLAASIGRWVGRARSMARQFREQLESEADSIKSTTSSFKHEVDDVTREFDELKPHLDLTPPEPPTAAPMPEPPTAAPTPAVSNERGS